MALNLYMVGIHVRDMPRSVAFYRALGLAVPLEAEKRVHVQIKMGDEFTLFLDARPFKRENAPPAETPNISPVMLEFYLKTQAAVEAKAVELAALGYPRVPAPLPPPPGMHFVFIEDPDGNPVLLSGDLDPAPATG